MWHMRRVVGSSMSPTLKPGQLICLTRRFKYRPQQIVSVTSGGRTFLKRIKLITRHHIYLEGDGCCSASLCVSRKDVKGALIAKLPFYVF